MKSYLKKLKDKISIKDILIFLIPILIFVFTLLSYWPGIMTYDGDYQWNQIQNKYISDAHPFLSTFVPLLLSKIWNSKTVVQVFQIIVFSVIWTYMCKNYRIKYKEFSDVEKNINRKQYIFQVVYTIFICILPIIFVYAITFWKDVLFTYGLLLLIIMIYRGIETDFKYNVKDLIILSFILVFIQLYRHNGVIIFLVMVPTFFIIFIKKEYAKKQIAIFLISLVVFESLIQIPKHFIVKPSLDIMETAEGLTIFITGALLHAEVDMEEEDLSYLNSLMPVNTWKELYTPYLINTVPHSPLLNKEKLNESFNTLFKIFVKYAIKNPQVIIMHYLKADALLWSPFPIGYVYIFDFSEFGPEEGYNHYGFDDKVETKFEIGKKICDGLIGITMNNGFVRTILYRPATAMYISILIIVLLVRKLKNKKYYMLLLPMLLNLLSLMPANLAQDLRYVYINYITLVSVFLIYIMKSLEKDKKIKLISDK